MDDTRKRCIVDKLRRHDNRRCASRSELWAKFRIGQKRDLPSLSRGKCRHLCHDDSGIAFKLPA